MAAGSDHLLLRQASMIYTKSVLCCDRGPYLMINETELRINVGSTTLSYSKRMENRWNNPIKKKQFGKNWQYFGFQTVELSSEEETIAIIRYMEDVFILLFAQNHNEVTNRHLVRIAWLIDTRCQIASIVLCDYSTPGSNSIHCVLWLFAPGVE